MNCNIPPKTPAIVLNRTGPEYSYDNFVQYDTSSLIRQKDKEQFKNTFIGANPILRDVFRPEPIPLDRPPLMTQMTFEDIYKSRPNTNYNRYSDISYGNITYWLPQNAGEIYNPTLFTTPSKITHKIRVDPMGVVNPEYVRYTTKPYTWNLSSSKDCNSSTHDTLEFRQSIMESQMRKRNSQESKYYL